MGKNSTRIYIVDIILLAVFSVIAFVVPFTKNAVFWISYIFGIIAIVAQLYFINIAFVKGKDVKSKFYGFPIAKIGVLYLGMQMGLSLVGFGLARFIPVWVVIVLDVLPIAFAAIGCIAADVMREEIERQDVQIKTDVSNMRSLQSLSASLVGMCQDADLKKKLQDVADDFKYSDPVSSDNTKDMETELKFLVGEIQRALVDGDNNAAEGFCMRVKANLVERNRVCKLEK